MSEYSTTFAAFILTRYWCSGVISRAGQGVVTIMVQSCCVFRRFGAQGRFDVVIPPLRFLQRGTADCTYTALENSVPELSSSSLGKALPSVYAVMSVNAVGDLGVRHGTYASLKVMMGCFSGFVCIAYM
jgi:hypothetical protein